MWNIDIETRIRDLNAEADNRHARLLDTMTETDGSAKSGRFVITRIVERVKQAFGVPSRSSHPALSRPTFVVSSK